MLFEGTRDFIAKFYAFGFANDTKIKEELDTKILPKYLPIFNKVGSTWLNDVLRVPIVCMRIVPQVQNYQACHRRI